MSFFVFFSASKCTFALKERSKFQPVGKEEVVLVLYGGGRGMGSGGSAS